MSTPAAGVEGGQGTEQGQEAPQGPDFSPVLDRIDQLGTEIGSVREWIDAQQQTSEEPDEESYEDFVTRLFAGEEPGGEPAGMQQQQAQQALPPALQDPATFQQLLDRHYEQRFAETVAPELQQLREERWTNQVNALMQEFPALQEEEVAKQVTAASTQLAQELGRPELWNSPALVRAAFLMQRAQETSDAEVPAGANGGEARLEAGGGNPGAEEPGLADQLIQAHGGSQSIFR